MPESTIGFYGHVKQYHNLKAEIDQAILDVLESGSYVLGPQLVKFEEELARYMNVRETGGVNSGTDALLLVFLALGLGPGDEIITTSNTFFATAEAIWLAGATPVLVDSDPKTRNIDVTQIEAAITSKTRAIVPVHLYGLTANMPEIARIAKAHNLFVVEDCAQAIGARGDHFAIGELSDAVCLSFIIQKNLGCFGDGGAVATNNQDLAANIRKLRNHGSLKRSYHSIGYNSRLDDIHAAVLRVKLKHVDEWSERRREIARLYDQGLADASMTLPFTPPGYEHVYHLYVVETDDRDGLQSYLNSKGIAALTHYPIAIHQQEGFPWGRPARVASLPTTERSVVSLLSLPMYPELTNREVERVIEEVLNWTANRGALSQQTVA
ncbi:MAG TPA: DegT/DnrJ/EryC1/StrS family aminotransferase [Terriglobales bacterium]|jgi:dTDP-4-amino-4,6-dideoxygalactose transaminase|nr:DegT/DnrJ/EryC1/StrS family aminotransferase [Terriglobales bacterium]